VQYQKPKSAIKNMMSRGTELNSLILKTLKTCSDIVGSTLGPGGMSVVIEHQEVGLPPIITKDGVTVFRNLGFKDSTSQVLLEAARDAAVRTASEAGDGTTTATILSEAFVRYTQNFCHENTRVSPQVVMRTLQKIYRKFEPLIEKASVKASLSGGPEDRRLLESVARISANGDEELASAVMKCFDVIGDEGNVTIYEQTGPSGYEVQKIEGYPVGIGYEDCGGPFYAKFINDPGTQTTLLEKPSFLLYYGKITDFNTLYVLLNKIADALNNQVHIDDHRLNHNVIVVATGFSETVLANLAAGFVQEGSMNVYPLLVPPGPSKTAQLDFIQDLAALTGGSIFDVLQKPLQHFEIGDLGYGPRLFEATRFRTNIIGRRDDMLVLDRVDQVQKQLSTAAISEMEKTMLRERVAKLTSGIARLIVQGSSNGETKEKRDRAEDAVCAVRGAIKHGILPGGGGVLASLAAIAKQSPVNTTGLESFFTPLEETICREVFAPAVLTPVIRLYTNAGINPDEAVEMANNVGLTRTYDVQSMKWRNPWEAGIVDSLPAVREALRNSISIAGLLGTCGGTVVFKRDHELDLSEARDTADFLRNANVDERD